MIKKNLQNETIKKINNQNRKTTKFNLKIRKKN